MKRWALAAVWLGATPAEASEIAAWRAPIAEASARFGIPVDWIERVMTAESAGRTRLGGKPIVSSAGAMGLMQLMPGTWAAMRARLGLGTNPHHPRDNILAGTLYLRLMFDRYGYPGLFAAYNAGPGRYEAYLRGGRRLPAETRAYVAAVAKTALDPGERRTVVGLAAGAGHDGGAAAMIRSSGRAERPIFFARSLLSTASAQEPSGSISNLETRPVAQGQASLFVIGGGRDPP